CYSMIGYAGIHAASAGGTVLPCGARLKFHPMALRDAKWVPWGCSTGPCFCTGACADKSDLCDRACYEKLTDAKGELTEKGGECVAKCNDKLDACQSKC